MQRAQTNLKIMAHEVKHHEQQKLAAQTEQGSAQTDSISPSLSSQTRADGQHAPTQAGQPNGLTHTRTNKQGSTFCEHLAASVSELSHQITAIPQGPTVLKALDRLRAVGGDVVKVVDGLRDLEEALSVHAVNDEWRDLHKANFLRALEGTCTPAQCGVRMLQLLSGLVEKIVKVFKDTETTKSSWARLRKGRMFVPEIGQSVVYIRTGHHEHVQVFTLYVCAYGYV